MKKNCLLNVRKELANQWHPTKNKSLSAKDVTKSSQEKVWWLCDEGHEWEAAVVKRAVHNQNCPYCANKKVCNDNCLATTKPELVGEWHFEKNNPLTPNEVVAGSNKKVWWICEKGHEWAAIIVSRTLQNTNCPYCAGQKLSDDNCLATRCPSLANEWHPTKNIELTPREVTAGSNKKVWWMCEKGHEWEAIISDRNRERGCPYCGNKEACKDNSLQKINPLLALEWNYNMNKNLTPEQILPNSGKKFWWICEKGHEWKAQVASRNRGRMCPYCKNRKTGEDNNLAVLSAKIANQWHPTKNSPLSPKDVTPGSNKKVWWVCEKGHEWETTINSRNKRNCPECNKGKQSSFPEQAIFYYCQKIIKESSLGKKLLGYNADIVIYDEILIEYDGYYFHKDKKHDQKKTILL